MIILALDSAGKTAGTAVWRDGALLYENYLAAAGTHSETLLRLVRDALKATRLTCADVDVLGVNAGPGSFTGLRIGLAAAKGLAFAYDTPCAGVSTLASLAQVWPADGLIAAALDARRGQVYGALFQRADGRLMRLTPDGALSAADFRAACEAQAAAQSAAQGVVQRVVVLGDGAQLVCGANAGGADAGAAQADSPASGAHPPTAANLFLAPPPLRFGRAYGVCLAAAEAAQQKLCVAPEALVPNYHRLSQAERERAEKLAQTLCASKTESER